MSDSMTSNHIKQLVQLCRSDSELQTITYVLKDLTDLMKNEHHRSKVTHEDWNAFVNITNKVETVLNENDFEDEKMDFLANFLRFLRNSCAGSVSNQQFIINNSKMLSCIKKTLKCFKERKSEKEVAVLKCCVQLFGNLVCVGNSAKSLVWNIFFEEKIYKSLFEHDDGTVREYAMMVLYNSMSDEAAKYLIGSKEGHLILTALVNSLCDDLVDWGILFLELILKQEDFMKNCYENFPLQSRLLILDIVTEQISRSTEDTYFFVHYSSINYIKDTFIAFVMNIVHICSTEPSDMKPVEIVKLLSLLCAASVSDTYNQVLKCSRELLETSLDTLKTVHLLGKKSTNAFSCISNFKVTNQITKEEIEGNPSYGFKKNLIRLIGNLCYNCKENQDLVRKLDGIPLLLDCCSLDARNPFIMQWCILAIRNILEKNSENQSVLAGVSITGDLVDSSLIRELGFEVHSENGKFVLKSIESLN